MINRDKMVSIAEGKDPLIMGLLPKWRIKSKKEASWSPASGHEYRISQEAGGWEFHYFAPGARTGERSGPKNAFRSGYKAADAAELDWKKRSASKSEAKTPAKLKGKKLSAEINRLYGIHGHGAQIPIMDLGKISKAGTDAYDAGEDMEAAIKAAIQQYRKN